MNPEITVRTATTADAPALARLNAAFNGASDPPERLAERMLDPLRVEIPILAEIDNRAVGFTALRVVPSVFYASPHAELTELYVEPDYQRIGVGRALIRYAENLARDAGAEALMLLTGTDNHDAQQFYRALGYADHDLSMIKSLV